MDSYLRRGSCRFDFMVLLDSPLISPPFRILGVRAGAPPACPHADCQAAFLSLLQARLPVPVPLLASFLPCLSRPLPPPLAQLRSLALRCRIAHTHVGASLCRPEDGMCSLKDCSVCECTEEEIPLGWRKPKAAPEPADDDLAECSESTKREASARRPSDPPPVRCMGLHSAPQQTQFLGPHRSLSSVLWSLVSLLSAQGIVDRSMNESGSFLGWREIDNPWTAEDESSSDHTCARKGGLLPPFCCFPPASCQYGSAECAASFVAP